MHDITYINGNIAKNTVISIKNRVITRMPIMTMVATGILIATIKFDVLLSSLSFTKKNIQTHTQNI